MIAAGCHVKVIAEQMGHSDGGGLVLERYGHLYAGAGGRPRPLSRLTSSGQTGDSAVGWMWDEKQTRLDVGPVKRENPPICGGFAESG